ncbi:hypothetical protein LEP1GSC066_2918 [Leptospira sp. serovar Kenya str. Sh9]|uniref:Uncharacterized protein n=1 Tax=Leptospira borgpetersenii serovar Ballum TaxID=280505 RepID=A0A0S2ITY3_LEPBO|nr:hypothetical protein LBBP_02897 [Leptospira borgpetersenii serovar Ballum]EMK12087.1 hypothetical protein LEP1GSC066_2918 [Leptospira sp. serovar Kenya str. Sh9]EMN13626.1 hypothetical protein LEP1GSC055_3181 [Leptospira borgpetersenii str. Brem 307]
MEEIAGLFSDFSDSFENKVPQKVRMINNVIHLLKSDFLFIVESP